MKNDIDVAIGVVANYKVCSGTPCIIGHRIATAWLAGRFLAGESIDSIADDYDISTIEVENAVRYEFARRARRQPEFRARP